MVRTTDGRFIENRVLIDKKILREMIYKFKDRNKLTWQEISSILKVSPQTVMHEWLIQSRTLPLSKFNKIKNLSGMYVSDSKFKIIKPFWGQKLSQDKLNFKKVKLPDKNDKDFAEFYGIMLGDGCIFSDMNGISITGDRISDYFYYYEHLNNLIFKLFAVHPKFYINSYDRTIRCVLYSRKITRHLKKLGFPVGVKYNLNPEIPDYIFKDKKNLARLIRGLMDTDGSLSGHPNSKIMIHLSITMESLRDSVSDGLDCLGIKNGKFSKGIMIYTPEKIGKFHKIIGFSNFKNLYKYGEFSKNRIVPSAKEVEMFIRLKIKQRYGPLG